MYNIHPARQTPGLHSALSTCLGMLTKSRLLPVICVAKVVAKIIQRVVHVVHLHISDWIQAVFEKPTFQVKNEKKK